jgi:hypothetical protein
MITKNTTKGMTKPIEIKKNINNVYFENKNQYSLKQNFFDPTKSSPPNDFMIKLYNRIIQYDIPLQK